MNQNFATLRSTVYIFDMAGEEYNICAKEGNCEVHVNGWWAQETTLEHWIGVVLFYLQEDPASPAYTILDVRRAGMVCKTLGEIPEFEVLNNLIGYSWQLHAPDIDWAEIRRRISVHTHSLNTNCEGAD